VRNFDEHTWGLSTSLIIGVRRDLRVGYGVALPFLHRLLVVSQDNRLDAAGPDVRPNCRAAL